MRRTLTAVLAADVVGYSRMMSADADGTLATLQRLRAEILDPMIAAQRGRLVKSMGDGWIVTFESVTEAVECAMQVQDRLKIDGAMQMRTGIHIGDIAEADGDVFGDGVNIAARLQQAAEPGALAVSEAVYHLLDGTLRPSFDDAGERTLKNITHPVHVWARGGEVAGQMSTRKPAGFPDLIIRPVHTTDPRPDVQDLANALTGDLALLLDAVRDYSARVSQGPQSDGYELKTTLRASGERLRLEARLSAPDGVMIDAFKMDGDLSDVFDWQDEAAVNLGSHVTSAVFKQEAARIQAIPEDKRSADQWAFSGFASTTWFDLEGHLRALRCLDRALELEPENGFFYARALAALTSAFGLGYRDRIGDYADRLEGWAAQLDRLEPPQSPARILLVWSQIVGDESDTDRIRAEIGALTRYLPFDPELLFWAAWVHLYLGDPVAALECINRNRSAVLISPFVVGSLSQEGFAYLQLGQFDRALAVLEKCYGLAPNFVATVSFLISLYGHLERREEAKSLLGKLLRNFPDWSISKELSETGFVVTPYMQVYLDGLRKAGVPE